MKPKLFSLTVARNEASRYLASMLANAVDVVDERFFYDDRSTDDTLRIAENAGCIVAKRANGVPSFLEHEGQFRQAAFDTFIGAMKPSVGDWILSWDADEFLVYKGDNCCTRCAVDQAIVTAEVQSAKSIVLPVPEVFGWDTDGTPLVRTDGFWGGIAGTRLFRFEPGGRFANKPMGCGSEPGYIQGAPMSRTAYGLYLMHLGYSRVEDQVAKHQRYTSLLAHGHADSHVQSIVGPKTLKRWDGPIPEVTWNGQV